MTGGLYKSTLGYNHVNFLIREKNRDIMLKIYFYLKEVLKNDNIGND